MSERMTFRYWFERFSFSFVVIAAVLVWELYRQGQPDRTPFPQWKLILYWTGVILFGLMGVLGIRMRHQGGRGE